MSWLVSAPVLIPMFTAVLCMLCWRTRTLQRIISTGGAIVLFAVAIVLLITVDRGGIGVVHMAGWHAPFGISLVADRLAAVMVFIASLMGLAISIYALRDIDSKRESFFYHPLYHFLLMGVCGSFLTGDIFNLYVWFEVMLMSSFVLLALGGERPQLEGAIKYVTLNLMSSAIFLAGIGILYGITGTLNMADLAIKIDAVEDPGVLTAVSMLFLIAFGVKAAVFPLFFWLPASYHTPPVAISAIFAALLTKVGVYAMIRMFTLVFDQEVAYTHSIILVLAGFGMVCGVLGAAAQMHFRKILAFHSVSQIGYMIMGLGLVAVAPTHPEAAVLGLAGSVVFLLHHAIVKPSLFLVSGIAARHGGTEDLVKLGGLYRTQPWLAIMFIVAAFSLAGLPPFSGFWAKLLLVKAGLDGELYLIVGVALAVGLLTLFSMVKIWGEAFWKAPPEDAPKSPAEVRSKLGFMYGPLAALVLLIVLLGIFAQPMFRFATDTAEQLLDNTDYINAVLSEEYIEAVREQLREITEQSPGETP